ncbi:MAG: polysaccharide export protein [Bacteroidales bacterium]|nr:polysaccharide export protein [Bacteroidales bacterium]
MKKTGLGKLLFLMLLLISVMTSCTSYKNVPYLQNSKELDYEAFEANLFEPTIQPQDLLNIVVVNPLDITASMAYNLVMPSDVFERGAYLTSQPTLQNYIVSNEGTVNIPSVGVVKIAGLTIPEAEKLIFSKVKDSFEAVPSVTVRFVNFKISVLGEVNAPGSFNIKNGKVNVFEALALARDLTIYGMRDNVKIIRENKSGEKAIYEVDLNDANIITSPYFYLQQNDVVYVTPNESKAKNSDIGSSTSLWFSGTSILISLTSLLYNILK